MLHKGVGQGYGARWMERGAKSMIKLSRHIGGSGAMVKVFFNVLSGLPPK
jgi:hypothetical protein